MELNLKRAPIRKSKRLFTLLEIMVGIALVLIASGAIGWSMHGAIEKKRFNASLERFKERCALCQRLAIATQSDWQGTLSQVNKQWIFEAVCIENEKMKALSSLKLEKVEIFLEGKRFNHLNIAFFSSGQIMPSGPFLFCQTPKGKDSLQQEWSFSEIFQNSQKDKKKPPLHPAEL